MKPGLRYARSWAGNIKKSYLRIDNIKNSVKIKQSQQIL